MRKIEKEIEYEFACLKLYKNIAVVEPNESVNLTVEMAQVALNDIKDYFDGEYAFINNAKNTYSVDAAVYEVFATNERISCLAIVSYRNMSEFIFENFEKDLFGHKLVKLFVNLDDALDWAETILKKN